MKNGKLSDTLSRFSGSMFTLILALLLLLSTQPCDAGSISTVYVVAGSLCALLIYLVLAVYLMVEAKAFYRALHNGASPRATVLRFVWNVVTCLLWCFFTYIVTHNYFTAFMALW